MAGKHKICVLDLETTGHIYSRGDRIIQIGLVIIEGGQITHRFSQLINPEIPIPVRIQSLTGITKKRVLTAPKFEQVIDQIMPYLEGAIFVAHQAQFDLNFLQDALAAHGIQYEPVAVFDTVILSKILAPLAPGFNVGELSHYFGFAVNQLHDAYEDAHLTSQILQALAYAYRQLPEKIQFVLKQLGKRLSIDARLFFEEVAVEIAQRPPLVENKGNFSIVKQAEFNQELDKIQEVIGDQKRVVLQTNFLTFPLDSWIQECMAKGRKVLVVDDQVRENLLRIRKARDFIHLDYLQSILKTISVNEISEHEVVWWMSVLVWTSQTQTGLLEELPVEANIEQLLDKYGGNHQWGQSVYYKAHLKQIKKARGLWVHPTDLNYFISLSEKYEIELRDFELLIPSLEYFHMAKLRSKEMRFNVSELFTALHQFISQLTGRSKLPRTFLNRCHNLIQVLESVIELSTQSLAARYGQEKVNGEIRYRILSEITYLDLISLLSNVDGCIRSLRGFYQFMKGSRLQYYLNQFTYWYRDLIEIGHHPAHFCLEGIQIYNKFYQIQFSLLEITYQERERKLFDHWGSVVILDDLFATSYGQLFEIDRLLGNFTKIEYGGVQSNSVMVQVPVYYDDEKETTNAALSGLTHHLSQQIKHLAWFVSDDKNLKDKIIFIAPNKQAVEYLNQCLMETHLQHEYTILGENIYGSVRKIERVFKEKQQAIMILNAPYYKNSVLPNLEEPVSIFFLSLIFDPSHDALVQRIQSKKEWTDQQIFDNYILPRMQARMKRHLLMASQYTESEGLYLQDNRVFTKYYSSRLRHYLNPEIIFKILD